MFLEDKIMLDFCAVVFGSDRSGITGQMRHPFGCYCRQGLSQQKGSWRDFC